MRLHIVLGSVLLFLGVAFCYAQQPPPGGRGGEGGRGGGGRTSADSTSNRGSAFGGMPNPQASQPKWEYLVRQAARHGEGAEALNKLGEEGWELVAIEPGHASPPVSLPRYVFKRQKLAATGMGGSGMMSPMGMPGMG